MSADYCRLMDPLGVWCWMFEDPTPTPGTDAAPPAPADDGGSFFGDDNTLFRVQLLPDNPLPYLGTAVAIGLAADWILLKGTLSRGAASSVAAIWST